MMDNFQLSAKSSRKHHEKKDKTAECKSAKKFGFECCGKTLTSERQLIMHSKKHELATKHTKTVSGKSTKKQKKGKPSKSPACEANGTGFTNDKKIVENKGLIKGLPYECCGKVYKTLGWYNLHLGKHTSGVIKHMNSLTCSTCGKAFEKLRALTLHEKIHRRKSVFCEYCRGAFRDLGKLKRHMIIHTGEKKYECGDCGYSCGRKDHLRKHMMVHRPMSDRRYQCPHCDKGFIENSVLQRHLNTHMGIKPYTCSICQMSFFSDNTLRQHMSIHSSERPFTCDNCGRDFKRKESLKVHMRIHAKQRPYKCLVCGRRFRSKSCRTSHMRIHTGDRPFTCSKCSASFSDSGVYKYHMNRKTDCRLDKQRNRGHRDEAESDPCDDAEPDDRVYFEEVEDDEYKAVNESISRFNESLSGESS